MKPLTPEEKRELKSQQNVVSFINKISTILFALGMLSFTILCFCSINSWATPTFLSFSTIVSLLCAIFLQLLVGNMIRAVKLQIDLRD